MADKNRKQDTGLMRPRQTSQTSLPDKFSQSEDVLSHYLEKNAKNFSFFQAVELIQAARDHGRETGTHHLAADEKLFFEVDHSLGFPVSDIKQIEQLPSTLPDAPARYRMMVTFLGLHGSGTPLPSYYAERIAQIHNDEVASKGLFDFFHNRIIGLFYRSWRKHRYYRCYRSGAADPYSERIFSLFAPTDAATRSRIDLPWARLLRFSGALAAGNRPAHLLRAVIRHIFALHNVEVEQWVMRKLRISPGQLTRLGKKNSSLSDNFLLGERISDIRGKMRITIRQMDFKRFQDFLPDGKDFVRLRDLVGFVMRDHFAFDLKLCLRSDEAQSFRFGSDTANHLGWTTFLGRHSNNPANNIPTRDVVLCVRH